jgi:hypothetical protein
VSWTVFPGRRSASTPIPATMNSLAADSGLPVVMSNRKPAIGVPPEKWRGCGLMFRTTARTCGIWPTRTTIGSSGSSSRNALPSPTSITMSFSLREQDAHSRPTPGGRRYRALTCGGYVSGYVRGDPVDGIETGARAAGRDRPAD